MSNLKNYLFTSESVSEGHPDKVSDRISDMVVDSYLSVDPFSRVACETLTTTNKVVLAGEVRGPEIKKDELIEKVRNCIKDIGYDQDGFTWKEATKIESHLHSQSTDIAIGVDSSGNKDEGAGDQGIMFGYACDETDELMPAPIHYSHKILRLMAEDRKSGQLQSIEPDSKSQVTFEYINGKPTKVKSVVISSQHSADVNQVQVRDLLRPYILKSIPENFLKEFNEEEFYVNPTGNFVVGTTDTATVTFDPDRITEGTEEFTFAITSGLPANIHSTSITSISKKVNDTSRDPIWEMTVGTWEGNNYPAYPFTPFGDAYLA